MRAERESAALVAQPQSSSAYDTSSVRKDIKDEIQRYSLTASDALVVPPSKTFTSSRSATTTRDKTDELTSILIVFSLSLLHHSQFVPAKRH